MVLYGIVWYCIVRLCQMPGILSSPWSNSSRKVRAKLVLDQSHVFIDDHATWDQHFGDLNSFKVTSHDAQAISSYDRSTMLKADRCRLLTRTNRQSRCLSNCQFSRSRQLKTNCRAIVAFQDSSLTLCWLRCSQNHH